MTPLQLPAQSKIRRRAEFPERPFTGDVDPQAVRRARLLWTAAVMVLCPVALIGAALSFQTLYKAALPIFGSLAVGYPLLADTLILGSTLAYLAGATVGRQRSGWRWTAHGGVTITLVLNALAASDLDTLPWHITPPLVWSILVEMAARQVTASWKALHTPEAEPVPVRLWITSPLDTIQTWLHMARTGQRCHREARADLALQAAAGHALRAAMPQRRQRRSRRLISRQLRAGALDPAVVLDFLNRHSVAGTTPHHATVIFEAFPSYDRSPLPEQPQPTGRGTPGKAEKRTRDQISWKRPPGSPDLQDRRRAATEIVHARTDIDGPQLARALTDLGWPVSFRTARRILAQIGREQRR